jgi:hypothetical protein
MVKQRTQLKPTSGTPWLPADLRKRQALAGELDVLAAKMTPAELDEARRRVGEWRERARAWSSN